MIDQKQKKLENGILGLVVGDAVGVPYEFTSRDSMIQNPATNMTGFGTHDQPKGTWSDDSSLTLITYEVLKEYGDNVNRLAEGFRSWLNDSYMTPYGVVFDIGVTTYKSIQNLNQGISPFKSGETGFWSNGNGSLMRILPLLLLGEPKYDTVQRYSGITHAHTISCICCYSYLQVAWGVLNAKDKNTAVLSALQKVRIEFRNVFQKMNKYNLTVYNELFKIFELNIEALEKDYIYINSGTYVIDTLISSIYCLLNTDNFEESILTAVNLGGDTDTTAAVVGGLTGMYYGSKDIPVEWIDAIVKNDLVDDIISKSKV